MTFMLKMNSRRLWLQLNDLSLDAHILYGVAQCEDFTTMVSRLYSLRLNHHTNISGLNLHPLHPIHNPINLAILITLTRWLASLHGNPYFAQSVGPTKSYAAYLTPWVQ